MNLISEALLRQLLKAGTPVLIIPESSLMKDEDEEDDMMKEKYHKSHIMISPS